MRRPLLFTGFVWATILAGTHAADPTPLLEAHAHNDYYHERPLHDALAEGFASVEADIFLRQGELLVGHDLEELRANRTLQSLYLEPLSEIVDQNGGSVWPTERPFLLFIDIKDDPAFTRPALAAVLAQYRRLLSPNGARERPAVRVVISGSPPRRAVCWRGERLATADGRLADLGCGWSSDCMPVISDRWSSHFTWTGEGEIPETELARLNRLVECAHVEGKLIRFWATPEQEKVWRVLLGAGVDLINTDDLGRLQSFLDARTSAL